VVVIKRVPVKNLDGTWVTFFKLTALLMTVHFVVKSVTR